MVAPLCPVEAPPSELGIAGLSFAYIDTELRKPKPSVSRHSIATGFLSNKDTEILKLADNFNCDLSGQMGIATPRVREPVGLLTSRNALHEMFWMRRNRQKRFDRVRYFGIGDSIVSMPSLLFNRKQTAANESRQVTASRLWRHIGDHRQLPRRKSNTADKGQGNCCTSWIAQQSGRVCQILAHGRKYIVPERKILRRNSKHSAVMAP